MAKTDRPETTNLTHELCEVCGDNYATVRVTAANSQGELLDTHLVCGIPKCLARVGDLLEVGRPTGLFKVRS